MQTEIRSTSRGYELVDRAGRVHRVFQSELSARRVQEQFAALPEPGGEPVRRFKGFAVEPMRDGRFAVVQDGQRVRVMYHRSSAERVAEQLAELVGAEVEGALADLPADALVPAVEDPPSDDPSVLDVGTLLLSARHISTLKRAGYLDAMPLLGKSRDELEALPGIGPTLADALVEALSKVELD